MNNGSVTLNEVIEALKFLDGSATSIDIQDYIIQSRGGILPDTYKYGGWDSYRKTITQMIHTYCHREPKYKKYKGPAYFEYLGPGFFKLKNFSRIDRFHFIETNKIDSHFFAKEIKIDEVKLEELLLEKKEIGRLGEEKVIEYEKNFLINNGRSDLANYVQQISKKSISEGYDILSFDINGNKKFIEVTSSKSNTDCFYLTDNELNVARQLNVQYWIYKVILHENGEVTIKQFNNPANKIDTGDWDMSPLNYLIKCKNT